MAGRASPGLEAQLEGALIDAMGGDPWGPALAGRLHTVARAILLRHGLGAARIDIQGDADGGVSVTVRLPPGRARVQQLTLRLDPQ